jgi:quercetin dioxygenase-like cupin family protein
MRHGGENMMRILASLSLLVAYAAHAEPAPAKPPASPAAARGYVHGDLAVFPGKKPVEQQLIADGPALKTLAISLTKGAPLPEHAAAGPAIIHVLSGKGTMKIGGGTIELMPGRVFLLEPAVGHLITPEKDGDMLLLVHHVKAPPKAGAPPHGHTP